MRRVRVAEGSALKALKEKLFTHRSELLSGLQQYDLNNTGELFSLCWPCSYLTGWTCAGVSVGFSLQVVCQSVNGLRCLSPS